MRNTHSKFIDKILKEIWSDIDTKMNDGIYTEEFLTSLYNKLSEYVDEDFATEFLREIETTSGEEKPETGDEKELDSEEKYDMMTQAERDKLKQSKETDDELAKSTNEGFINEAGFTYTELTKSGGKYQPPFLAHIQGGKEFDLDGDYEGEKDVLVKQNLDLTGFGDKSLLQILSGGTKEEAREFFKSNSEPILVGKSGRKYSLNQISKSTFTGQGGGTKPTDAAYYEMGISVEYNKLKGMNTKTAKEKAEVDFKKYSKYENYLTEVCGKVAKNLPDVGPYLRQTGGDRFSPSKEWPSSDGTPKTDIFGGSNNRISVKKVGGSQLVSGKGGDAKGVFKGGLSFYDKYDSKDGQSHIKYVIDNIEKDFKTYNSDNQVGDIRKQAGEAFVKWRVSQIKSKAKPSDIEKHAKAEAIGAGIIGARGKWNTWFVEDVKPLDDKAVLKWFSGYWKSLGNEVLQGEMKNVVEMAIDHKRIDANFKQAFQNDSFKKWCVYEASAGTYKFTGVADTAASNDAVANKILVFGEDGKVQVKEITPSWAKGYASNVTPIVAFKSSGRSKFTAFRLMQEGYNPYKSGFENDLNTIIKEETSKIDTLITESVEQMDLLLNEINVKGFLKSISRIAKKLLKKITDSIKNFYERVIKKVLKKLREFAKSGIEKFCDYLGIEINGSADVVINF